MLEHEGGYQAEIGPRGLKEGEFQKSLNDLMPEGYVVFKDGEWYVASTADKNSRGFVGWKIDKDGYYKEPLDMDPAMFNRLKSIYKAREQGIGIGFEKKD